MTFDEYETSQSIKMLYIGNSGSGKTGSLVSLAAAGYQVRILDLDKGVEVIKDFVLNPASPYRHDSGLANSLLQGWSPVKGLWSEELGQSISKRISFVPLDETLAVVKIPNSQMKTVPKGDLYSKIQVQFDSWKEGEKSFGSILTWGPDTILVIDGLSRFGEAIFNQQLAIGGRLISRPEQSDYGMGQRELIRNLMLLYSDAIKCHVIMVCHLDFIETEAGPTKVFPKTNIGKAVAPIIGTFFNHALLAQSTGQGPAERRIIKTNTSGMIELKTAAPLRVKGEYSLSTGLAEYFRDVLGRSGPLPSEGKTEKKEIAK